MSITAAVLAPIPAVGNIVAGVGLAIMAGLRVAAHWTLRSKGDAAAPEFRSPRESRRIARDAAILRDRARAVEALSPGYAADLYAAADRSEFGR